MTTPDRPLRMELTFEMPGTAEQVWDAIATANGITSWFVPTDMEEREGGLVRFHMGEDASEGTVTRLEPPHRIVYEEPDWAGLSGHAGAEVTPLVSEFIVEAQAGGTCVVRVVSSAFGTGADWEQEFFDEMEQGWVPFFDHLRLYLQHFPGQQVSRLSVDAQVPGTAEAAVHAMQQALGVEKTGQQLDARGLDAQVEAIDDNRLLLRVAGPVPGYVAFLAWDTGDGKANANVAGYLFSEKASAYVEAERSNWKAWLDDLSVHTA
jgi:uncharacterized protein YndB with AHSA1/START domain